MDKDYIIIWLDSNIDLSNEVHQNVIIQLQQVINPINTFTDKHECVNFIRQIKNKKIFMIVSNNLGEQIVPLIQDILQLKSIYVFCDDQSNHIAWIKQSHIVKGPFSQINDICNSLNNAIRRYNNYLTTISNINLPDIPNQGLNELDQSFMYSQLLKEILIDMKYDDKTNEIEKLVAVLRERSTNNDKLIDEFKEDYESQRPIYWYTKCSFIYLTLNEALRTQNINIIIKMGFFIQDLHRQIKELHSKDDNSIPPIIYRGQVMLKTDFEKMKICKGGLLSFNNFFSTSADSTVSLMYADRGPQNIDTIGILFEIEIDHSISYTPFTAVNRISNFEFEEEILFSMNTVFRIGNIEKTNDELLTVKLMLTSDNDEQLQHVTDSLRKEIGGGTGWHRLGYLMILLDENKKAEEIYTKLLDHTSTDKHADLAAIYNQLGLINEKKGDYETALSFFLKVDDIEGRYLLSDSIERAITYNNIAEVYHTMTNYSAAHDFHQKAFTIREKHNDPSLTATYSNIAGVYLSMGDYENAQSNYEKALQIGQDCFSPKHPDLATIYDNLATIHTLMGEYSQAFGFYQKAREINHKSLPPSHILPLITDHNIASAFDSMGNYSDALSMYEKILEVQQKSLHPNHPTLALIYNNVGIVCLKMGRYSEAYSYYQKALEIQKKCPYNSPDLATTYSNIGEFYQTKREFNDAILYYEKALEIDKSCHSSDHPHLATTYHNLGEVYIEKKQYTKAFSFLEKALQIREKCFPANHPLLASVYNSIGHYHQNIGNYSDAISFHQKALKIHEESDIPNDPELAVIYNNMGTTYYRMKNYSSAITFYQNSLDIESKSLGSNHPNLAYTHNNIACAFEGLYEYQKAFNHIQRAINIATDTMEAHDSRRRMFHDHLDTFLLKILHLLYRLNKQVS